MLSLLLVNFDVTSLGYSYLRYTFIGLPQAKKIGSSGWVLGPFCVANVAAAMYRVLCYSIHQIGKYLKQNTLKQTTCTCNNIGCTSLQALLDVLFVEQTPTDGTVIYLLTRDCLCCPPWHHSYA